MTHLKAVHLLGSKSSGRATLQLVAGPAAKIPLLATPTALPAHTTTTSQLAAEILDVHGNRVSDDSTTTISFSISGGPGEILNPAFALAANERAGAVLQTTSGPGKILVFAGASGLAPATFEIPVHQAVPPQFTAALDPLKLVEDGPAVQLALGDLVSDGDSDRNDLSFAVSTDSAQVHLEIVDGALVATPVTPDFWGESAATITVRDPTGLETSVPLSIAVQSRNDPPHITSTPDTVIAADVHFVYQLTATDADADALTYRLLEGPRGLPSTRRCSAPCGAIHPRVATRWSSPSLTAKTTSYQRFQIQVGQPADLRFETQPITRARRGQLYSYQPAVANADGDALSFYLLEGPQRMRVDSQTGMLG